mgnify:CR=1 FL=1
MRQIRNASDTTCKQILRDEECFADLCNYAFFQGRQVIKPEELVSRENDLSTLIGNVDDPTEIKRYRDVVRKASIHGDYVIIGVEHQSTFDKNMIFRILNYDATTYINQVESKKEVHPVGSFVFYTGDKKWNTPLELNDYFDIPEELKAYINEWKFIFVDVKEIDTSKIKDEQTRYFIEAIQEMYKGNFEGLHRRIKMNRDNFIYAAIITGSLDLIRDLPEGDEIDMCEGMERMAEGFRNEGRKEGEKREKKTVLSLLKVKLGNVSNQLEQAIQNSSIEKLNTLTLSIFDITNEDDVLKIIN